MAGNHKAVYSEGFRDRNTGCLYFSAAAQAVEAAEACGRPAGVDADCQAHYTRADAVQTNAEAESQTPAPGAPSHVGRTLSITVSPSNSSAAAHAVKLIQAQTRGWLVRKHIIGNVHGLQKQLSHTGQQQQPADAAAAEEAKHRDLQRQLHPKTAADFAMLHEKVKQWMAQETAAVKAANLGERERQDKLLELCRKEVKYLQTIGWRHAAVLKASKAERESHLMQQATAPEHWAVHDGGTVSVITPSVARAQELASMHAQLRRRLSADERVAVLLQVRTVLQAHGCHVVALELVNRELDLLKRGRSQKSLQHLHHRILDTLQDAFRSS